MLAVGLSLRPFIFREECFLNTVLNHIFFRINPNSGVLYVGRTLDADTRSTYTLTVTALDQVIFKFTTFDINLCFEVFYAGPFPRIPS